MVSPASADTGWKTANRDSKANSSPIKRWTADTPGNKADEEEEEEEDDISRVGHSNKMGQGGKRGRSVQWTCEREVMWTQTRRGC